MEFRACRVLSALALALAVLGWPSSMTAREIVERAHWVQEISLQSPESIRRMVTTAAANGFNTLFVPVTGSSSEFDPLREVIDAARERGMRVHAWLHVNLVAVNGELPASRDHVIYQHPEWLMVPRELAPELQAIDVRSPEYLGRLARWTRAHADRVDGLYLSPLHVGAQLLLAATVKDLVTRYDVDGIQLDDVRFPATDFDYSRAALDAFRADLRPHIPVADRGKLDAIETIDPYAYTELRGDDWRMFRQTRLTALVTRLRSTARSVRPDIIVSAAVDPDAAHAAREMFQDWRTWVDNGFIDALCALGGDALVADVRALAGSRPVWVRD